MMATDDTQRTMAGVGHKLSTGELKTIRFKINKYAVCKYSTKFRVCLATTRLFAAGTSSRGLSRSGTAPSAQSITTIEESS